MTLSCYLIGEDSLLIQCASQLFAQNHAIALIISPIKSVQTWATTQGIPWVKSLDEVHLSDTPVVDCIFSIVNSRILTPDLIKLARVAVINYHDSLLPDYAGLNATSWAILNGETRHGVSWHLVNEAIDEGDILVQRSFAIEPYDTALTLNLRCYEQAIASFGEVLDCLAQKPICGVRQVLHHKRYFSATHLLPHLGFIDWHTATAKAIITLHQAVTLGHYRNNIGLPKIYLNDDFLIITGVSRRELQTSQRSGTLLSVSLGEMTVATCRGEVVSLQVRRAGNEPLTTEFMTRHHLLPGASLAQIPAHLISSHGKGYRSALKQERFWIKKLKELTEHTIFTSQAAMQGAFQKNKPLKLHALLSTVAKEQHAMAILTSLLIYFFKINNYEKTDVLVASEVFDTAHDALSFFFPSTKPLSIPPSKESFSLEAFAQVVTHRYQEIEKKAGFLADVYHRQPDLEHSVSPTITLSFKALAPQHLPSNTLIYVHINAQEHTLVCYHRINKAFHSGAIMQLMRGFNAHLKSILSQLIHQPTLAINQLSFLSKEEYKQLMQWGEGKKVPLSSDTIVARFEHHVRQNPSHPALLMGEHAVSYLALWQMSEAIARALTAKGVRAHALVGLYLNRTPLMLASIMAILRLNAVYVPLDAKYPLGKIDLIVSESQLSVVVTNAAFIEKLSRHFKNQPSITLVNGDELLHQQPLENFPFNPVPVASSEVEKLSYIMFTSGTTGVPKGVMISQRNVLNYCSWFTQTTDFNRHSIIDFSSSIAFDLSVPCTLAPLIVGGTIAVCAEPDKINPQRYLQHLQHHHITHTELTPGYVELLLNYPDDIRKLHELKFLMLGADVLHATEVAQWLALNPATQIVNEYGPTETTVSVTSYFVKPDCLLQESAVPIGRPAFNSQAYVVDKFANLCPPGMKGELCIAGAQVAVGYLNKPQLTADKFTPLTLPLSKQTLVYKTGDEVCWLPDGQLQFFGRNDFQIKIHGYRVEIPAIETVLMQYPDIHQAVVVVKHQARDKYLRAYLIAEKTGLTLSELMPFLANYLPFYMIPKEFCLVDAIPLKENEKIDFEGLESQPQKRLIQSQAPVQDALTSTEQRCLHIWQMVFNRQLIQMDDNFFDLGGDSLMALQIINALKTHYSLSIPLSVLFECSTIHGLAQKLDELLAKNHQQDSLWLMVKNPSKALIKLATGTYPIPLFLVHPVGGSIFWYQQLAQHLQGKYTIYGIQDTSIDGDDRRFKTLEEMASFYLQAIASVYRGERYCLGGASFGATVAFEMAHQLQHQGASIEFLGLMDGWARYPEQLMQDNSVSLLTNTSQQLTKAHYDQLVALEEYRKKLLLDYHLPVVSCEVTLFKAQELWSVFNLINDPYNGWRPFVRGKINLHTIPGTHESMFFNPHVDELARTLSTIVPRQD